MVDTAGQVDRFMRRLQSTQSKQADVAGRRDKVGAEPRKRSLYQEVFGDEEAQPAE
jgi:large subunit ribosomal protein L31